MRLRDFTTDECHIQWTLAWPQRCDAEKFQEGFRGKNNSLASQVTRWLPVVFILKKKPKSFLTESLKRKDWID